jgi:hypothetical protein
MTDEMTDEMTESLREQIRKAGSSYGAWEGDLADALLAVLDEVAKWDAPLKRDKILAVIAYALDGGTK